MHAIRNFRLFVANPSLAAAMRNRRSNIHFLIRAHVTTPTLLTAFVGLVACGSDSVTAPVTPVTPVASNSPFGCALTYSAFNSSARVNATSTYTWSCSTTLRSLSGNGIPDHPVTTGNFATPIGAQSLAISMPVAPSIIVTAGTKLTKQAVGYVLNGVKLDPETDGSCTATATSTANGAGCVAIGGRDPWVLEAIGGAFAFGTDESNAHVQPNGQYHYHGLPEAYITKANKGVAMTLVGFAVDGFPMYARYGFATATSASSAVRVMTSSWQKKTVPDAGRPSTSIFPMGTFTSDYQYVAGSGDLDECNGRTGVTPEFPGGTYHYYITEAFPFIQRCVKGR